MSYGDFCFFVYSGVDDFEDAADLRLSQLLRVEAADKNPQK
jgi:hypothetical protein